jgi:hypothetical protein
MSELLEDRTLEQPLEPEDLVTVVSDCPTLVAPHGADSAPSANEADIAEPPAFADFWVDNFLLTLPIALGVLLSIFAVFS